MKHLHTLIVFLIVTSINAQTTETVFSHTQIFGTSMTIHGNELYFAGVDHIFKIDLTQANPSAVEVVEVGAGAVLFHGDELYFTTDSTISKIDITDQTPTVVDVITSGLNFPFSSAMTIKGNELYFSDSYPIENDDDGYRILKFDVTGSETTATTVYNGTNTGGSIFYDLEFYGDGNELYLTEHNFLLSSGKILKIDVSQPSPTPTEVLTGLNQTRGITFDGNDLYISSYGDNKISKIDVTDDSPALTDVVSLNTPPDKLIIEGEHLYIATNDSENEIGYIFRYTDSTLTFSSIDTQTPSLYPNPAKEELYFLGIDAPHPFRIYNLLGTEVGSGRVYENLPIDIRALTKGLYFVRLENGQTLKFVKN